MFGMISLGIHINLVFICGIALAGSFDFVEMMTEKKENAFREINNIKDERMKKIRKKNRNKSDNSTHENAKQCVKFLLSIL